MESTIIYNPTTLHFGKKAMDSLGTDVSTVAQKVLLLYGKGSIKQNGLYSQVAKLLQSHQIDVVEYGGIKSNPIIEDVNAAADLGRKEKVDAIVAVGGGSVIDSAKYIAVAICGTCDAWDYPTQKAKVVGALPLFAVLTLAATGTEMNPFAVVQNSEKKQKIGWGHPLMYPKHSYLDPVNTLSVPKNYTAYGIVDLIAHSLEAWFGKGDASLSDKFVVDIIQEALENGPLLMDDLQNYDLREKIMYAATMALNGLTLYGRSSADWGVHSIGHVLSLLYDMPHGASLSIAYPAWMSHLTSKIPDRIEKLGFELFNTQSPDDTIYKLKSFFRLLGSPVSLIEAGIDVSEKDKILSLLKKESIGMHHKLSHTDLEAITHLMFVES